MADKNAALDALDRMIEMDSTNPRRVLVLGDGMTDVYVHGRLEYRCQEECPRIIETGCIMVPGGAATASRSISNWRATTVFMASIGIVKTRYIAEEGDVRWCVFRSDNDDTADFDLPSIRNEAMKILGTHPQDAVLFSDYDKGLLTPGFIGAVISACNTLSIPCVADAKREPYLYRGALIKGNTDWYRRHRYEAGVITHGFRQPVMGGVEIGPNMSLVKCVNHIGAGDCFASHLTLALAYGVSPVHAVTIAHSAARVYVQHPHNRPPMPDEVRADLALA